MRIDHGLGHAAPFAHAARASVMVLAVKGQAIDALVNVKRVKNPTLYGEGLMRLIRMDL